MEKFGDNSYYNNKLEHFKYFYGKTSLVFGLVELNRLRGGALFSILNSDLI